MRELSLDECNDVDGGVTNIGTVFYSTAIGTGIGALAGIGFTSGGMFGPILGATIGGTVGAGFGLTIVFGAAILKFAGSETSI